MSENRIEVAILDWLYEHEAFGQRIERAPSDIIPWAFEAARIGANISDDKWNDIIENITPYLEDIRLISESPTRNDLEVGFRHSPLTIKEENQRLKDSIEIIRKDIEVIIKFLNEKRTTND